MFKNSDGRYKVKQKTYRISQRSCVIVDSAFLFSLLHRHVTKHLQLLIINQTKYACLYHHPIARYYTKLFSNQKFTLLSVSFMILFPVLFFFMTRCALLTNQCCFL